MISINACKLVLDQERLLELTPPLPPPGDCCCCSPVLVLSASRFCLCRSENCWCFTRTSLEGNCRLQRRQMSLVQSVRLVGTLSLESVEEEKDEAGFLLGGGASSSGSLSLSPPYCARMFVYPGKKERDNVWENKTRVTGRNSELCQLIVFPHFPISDNTIDK